MKRILIVLISVMMLVACSGTKKEEQPQKEEPPVETEEVKKLENDKEISNEAKAENAICLIVDEYNSLANEQLEFVEDFVPSNKKSGRYRTEFRLAAYKEAVGKHYDLGDGYVDIIASTKLIRLYTNGISYDELMEIVTYMSPIFDRELTQEELDKALIDVSEKRDLNGYYYGDLGIVLFGSDTQGYELMLKNDTYSIDK